MRNLMFSESQPQQKPSPPRFRGGEGWVKGQHIRDSRAVRSATRSPLTPTLFPKHSLGEREPTEKEAA